MNSYSVNLTALEIRKWIEAQISEKEKTKKRIRRAGLKLAQVVLDTSDANKTVKVNKVGTF